MIGPGGLVLVVSHLFAVFYFYGYYGLEKSKYLNLDVTKYFCWVRSLEMLAGKYLQFHYRKFYIFCF
jgi:hypothetical protein